ncbi:hypothetical protein LIA77_10270 [Sarocladium implicatum]|nr:hypothetical protein LIA77_10270 [Sarocladium implicatum]
MECENRRASSASGRADWNASLPRPWTRMLLLVLDGLASIVIGDLSDSSQSVETHYPKSRPRLSRTNTHPEDAPPTTPCQDPEGSQQSLRIIHLSSILSTRC